MNMKNNYIYSFSIWDLEIYINLIMSSMSLFENSTSENRNNF